MSLVEHGTIVFIIEKLMMASIKMVYQNILARFITKSLLIFWGFLYSK